MIQEERLFRLELDMAYPQICIFTKYFKSLKILNQWLKRNKNLIFLEHRKYVLTEKGYERFHIFANKFVTFSELQDIVKEIEKSEEENLKFVEYLKNQSIQIYKSEEPEYSKFEK